MVSKRHLKRPSRRSRIPKTAAGYQALEERRLLAVDLGYVAGALDIIVNSEVDTVEVETLTNGLVSVNGSTDLDTTQPGDQIAQAEQVSSITANGGATDSISFDNFDIVDATGNPTLQSITVNGFNAIDFRNLNLAADLNIDSPNASLNFISSDLLIAGNVNLIAGDSEFEVGNLEFGGTFSGEFNDLFVSSSGASSIDSGDLNIGTLIATGDVTIETVGDVTNAVGAQIEVAGTTSLTANSVTLGNQASDQIVFPTLTINTTNASEVFTDAETLLTDSSSATALTLESTGNVSNTENASLAVTGFGSFSGTTVTLGDEAGDVFNLGQVALNSSVGNAKLIEDSSTELAGTTFAQAALTLKSSGDITDATGANVSAAGVARLKAVNILLGDDASFDSVGLELVSTGDSVVDSESAILLILQNDVAGNLELTSDRNILDVANTVTNVGGNASFTGTNVVIGDQASNTFSANTLSFDSSGFVNVSSTGTTTLEGEAHALLATLGSTRGIVNLEGVDLDVSFRLRLNSSFVWLGNHASDSVQFASTTINTTHSANISADSRFAFAGSSQIGTNLHAFSDVYVADFNSTLSVGNNARFVSGFVRVGDTAADNFTAGSLSFRSNGRVIVSESDSTLLVGVNSARHLELSSISSIEDAPTASTIVRSSATFSGIDLVLGDSPDDCFDILDGMSGLDFSQILGDVTFELGC